jgi:signal transduction histidine kinase
MARALNPLVLAVQSAAALLLPRAGLPGFEGLLLSIVVAQVPTVLPLRTAVGWAVLQAPLLLAVVLPTHRPSEIAEILGAYAAFSAFALLVVRLHLQERRARADLADSNAALLGTRAVVVEGTRQIERLRIARELHDSLGHHLTALNLQLELAERIADGPVTAPVGRARAIARASLDEVRRVVGAMRAPAEFDLVAALRALAGGIAAPVIHVETTPEDIDLPPDAAHAIFRCVQEAVTNSVRHAAAASVRVHLEQAARGLTVRVTDDGEGAKGPASPAGTGMTGMRERAEELGGTIRFASLAGRGFEVVLEVPLAAAPPPSAPSAPSAPVEPG